jgi:protocatechuate 3,4-dioxygenase beta subunit
MHVPTPWIGRRDTLIGLSAAAAAQLLPSLSARGQVKLTATPRQTEGPFYPRDWQGDADNDLVVVRGEDSDAEQAMNTRALLLPLV